jgi:hypothetical protein
MIVLLALTSCVYDYGILGASEKEYVYITDTAVQVVEVEVEVPGETVYEEVEVEVEVPVYIETLVEDDPGEIWIDSFIQPRTTDGVDILWVIDTSGSMYRYDAQLLAGIEAMLLALPTTNWRLVMMANDPNQAAIESQFPLVPGDDVLDASAMYAAMGRGPLEHGFDAVYTYITTNPYASTWMRSDAALLVVFVSDEEEQSWSSMSAVSSFTSWYASLRGGSAYVASIVNHESAVSLCDWPVSPTNVGYRYMEATNYFGGVVVDICDEDWTPGVTDATHSIAPHESWPLTHEPVEDSLVVFINGVLDSNWTYSSSDNTVYFTTIPAAEALVEIGYRYIPIDSDTGDADTGTP